MCSLRISIIVNLKKTVEINLSSQKLCVYTHVSIYREMQKMQDTYHCLIRHNLLYISVKEGYCYSFPIRTHFFPRPIGKKDEVTAVFQNLFDLTNRLQRSVLRHHIQVSIDLSLLVEFQIPQFHFTLPSG